MTIVLGTQRSRSFYRFVFALARLGARLRLSGVILFLTAILTVQPAQAGDNVPPKVEVTSPGGVSAADGSFRYNVTDLTIGPLSLERFAISPSPTPPDYTFNGANMTNSFDIFVAPNFIKPVPAPWNLPKEYHPIVHLGAGASGMYLQNNPPAATASEVTALNVDGYAGRLFWSGTAYSYSDSDGVLYTFDASVGAGAGTGPSQRVSSIAFPDGRVRTFSYDANKHLKMVSDSTGYAIIFDWTGPATTDAISAACGFNLSRDYVTAISTCAGAPLKVTYGYTAGALTSFTDVLGQVTTYTWENVSNGGKLITCIKPPGYSVCKVQNFQNGTGYGAIYQQIMADGTTWHSGTDASFFLNDPEIMPPAGCAISGGFSDPNSKSVSFSFAKSTPCQMTDANGHTTTYTWTGAAIQEPWAPPTVNEGTMLVQATMPEGDQYLAEYNGGFNAVSKQTWKPKPGSPLPDRVVQYSYVSPCAPYGCSKISTKVDPKGNVTNYDYYSWSGLKSEMQPSPVRPADWTGSTPAIDKARPLKLYDYVQKYAYIKNSGGSLVAAATPVWLPNSETLCQTVAGSSAAVCDTAAPITVTTFEYGANGTADNLLLRGKVVTSGGVSLRTCYGYDGLTNKISETSPRAGLTSCS